MSRAGAEAVAIVSTARTGLPTARTPEEAPGPRSRSRRLVHAAGALVWRERGRHLEVLLVHRPRSDDWSFPKG